MLSLRPAYRDECAALTALCLRSKAAWGYDAAFMRMCRNELTLTPDGLEQSISQVAEDGGRVVGFAEIVMDGAAARLEKLFVEPDTFRAGVGRKLFDWAARMAAAHGASMMTVESDPQAAAFYRRMGALDDGAVASASIPGRMIPRLQFAL